MRPIVWYDPYYQSGNQYHRRLARLAKLVLYFRYRFHAVLIRRLESWGKPKIRSEAFNYWPDT